MCISLNRIHGKMDEDLPKENNEYTVNISWVKDRSCVLCISLVRSKEITYLGSSRPIKASFYLLFFRYPKT